jgi:hypothetical protein
MTPVGRKSTKCDVRYGFVLIDFIKHKLGVCTEEKLENTLVKALGVNLFVPYLMLQSENPALQSPYHMSEGRMEEEVSYFNSDVQNMSVGKMKEAVSYFNSAVGTWRRVPGLIDWLEELNSRDGPKPADDGTILFHLLSRGTLLVGIQRRGESNEIHEVTTNVGTMPRRLTSCETFSLPPGMKEHNPLEIVCYDTRTPSGFYRGEFISFSYDDVKDVYFWSLLYLFSTTFGKDLRKHYCGGECYCAAVAEFRCSKCGVVWYCSEECQRKDWKTNHKKMCETYIKT